MSNIELGLTELGILEKMRAKAAQLGMSIEECLISFANKPCMEKTTTDTVQFDEWKRRAEEFAGRPVQRWEVTLFRRFGTTSLSEVPDSELDIWEAELDACGQ